MHSETFEQFEISEAMIGEPAAFLQDGMTVTLQSHEGDPISVTLPDQVVVEVMEADAVIRANSLILLQACGCG